MAEAAGLVLGAAGLLGLFSSCVECFELVESGLSYAKDHALLSIKYDVEKTRLLIWGHAAGLFRTEGPYRNSLDKKWINDVVEKILLQIKVLFGDTADLMSKYGLEPIEDDILIEDGGRKMATKNLFKSFSQHLEVFQEKVNRQQKQESIVRKARWAIRDRKKFKELVDNIRELIDGLRDVTPDVQQKESIMVKEDMSVIDDPEDLRLINVACSNSNPEWSDVATVCIKASSNLGDLHHHVDTWMNNLSAGEGSEVASQGCEVVESSYHGQCGPSKLP